jgi:uncharacterized membrane protein YgcG
MMSRMVPIGVVLVALAVAAPGQAQTAGSRVRDRAGLFSPETVREVDRALQEVERESRWQAVVETVETLGGQTAPERALAAAKELKLRGVYVLIAKDEHKVQVEPSSLAARAFTQPKIEAIVEAVTAAFKTRQFDKGLRDAVALIRQDALAQPAPEAGGPVPTSRPREVRGQAAGSEVVDRAGLFSPDEVRQAEQALREIERDSHWQVVVETIESLEGRTAEDLVIANAKARNVHGLYILIPKKEHKVQVEPSHSAESTFTKPRIAAIVAALVDAFKAQQFDKGLRDAVALIRQDAAPAATASATTPAATRPIAPPAPVVAAPKAAKRVEDRTPPPPAEAGRAPGQGSGLLIPVLLIGGVILAVWILRGLFRAGRAAQGAPAYDAGGRPAMPVGYGPGGRPVGPPAPGYGPGPGYPAAGGYGPPPAQGGGGGFLSSALGGLGGAIAGNILYDKFGRPHPQQPVPHESHGLPSETAGSPSGPDPAESVEPPVESYDPSAGAGGDWGSPETIAPDPAADGGDWGTSDAGAGGDWGGGDTGGGGDWGGGDTGGDAGGGGDWGGDTGGGDTGGGDAGGGGSW